MADEVWPADIGVRSPIKFYLADASAAFDTPYAQGAQVEYRPGARVWMAELTLANLTRAQSARFDALLDRLRGMAGILAVPNFRALRLPKVVSALTSTGLPDTQAAVERPFADTGYYFGDTGYGFALNPPLTLTGAVAAGDTSVSVGGFLPEIVVASEGQCLSIGDRLYRVIDRGDVLSNGAGVATFTITPYARENHEAGAPVIFSRPVCGMRLVNEDGKGGQSDKLFSGYSLTFIEAI